MPAEGNLSLLPTKRNYTVELHGFQEVKEKQLEVIIENQIIETKISFDENRNAVVVQIPETSVTKEICLRIDKEQKYLKNNVMKHVFHFLNQAEIEFFLKDQIYALLQREKRIHVLMTELQVMNLNEKLLAVLMEMITAKDSL